MCIRTYTDYPECREKELMHYAKDYRGDHKRVIHIFVNHKMGGLSILFGYSKIIQ